jgi:hypothetical protein
LTCLTGHSLLLHEGQLTFWSLAALALALPAAGIPTSVARRRWSPWIVPAATLVLAVTLPARMAAEARRVDLLRVTLGLYDEERSPGGAVFRWTGSRAVFHVPADASVVAFDVRGLAPFPQTLQVRHDGQLIEQVPIARPEWLTLRYVLPLAPAAGKYRRFELRVTPTWSPRDDPRQLGVMLGPVTWSP